MSPTEKFKENLKTLIENFFDDTGMAISAINIDSYVTRDYPSYGSIKIEITGVEISVKGQI